MVCPGTARLRCKEQDHGTPTYTRPPKPLQCPPEALPCPSLNLCPRSMLPCLKFQDGAFPSAHTMSKLLQLSVFTVPKLLPASFQLSRLSPVASPLRSSFPNDTPACRSADLRHILVTERGPAITVMDPTKPPRRAERSWSPATPNPKPHTHPAPPGPPSG